MQYKSFRIRNFKGIKDTTVVLKGVAGANVFAFVGLNESGKTTILEAIHSFSPDDATGKLLGGEEGIGVPYKDRVPRHLISEFTGSVSVVATISLTESDKDSICRRLLNSHKIIANKESIPDEVVFESKQNFKNGDFKVAYFDLLTNFEIKSQGSRKWRYPKGDEVTHVRDEVYGITPDIAYFPTFVFDFPESIFLTVRGSAVDRFYRRVFQDILDHDGRGHTVTRDIVRRVRGEGMVMPWLGFLAAWSRHDDRDKIQHVMDRAGAAVTKLIFGRWNEIFGENTRGKEVIISYEVIEGEKEDENGNKYSTESHDVVAKFQIRDGTRRFNINDRSLGFRWFFSFMLFTQFRVSRSSSTARPLLFLFDEPASNLHAAAQQKLIESFPEIAKGEHVLAYSTHSHYMIEPKWLEQTFIVTNRSDAPEESLLDEISLDDESLDVKVSPYRSFVNEHPNQTSYFQPVLDRLNVIPSKFDSTRESIILEGKSDYYVLRYAQKLHGMQELPLLPGLGAGTFGALAALHVGWNLSFIFLLDGDGQGETERQRYSSEFGISEERLLTLSDIAKNVKVIEDLLDGGAKDHIQAELGIDKSPTKNQIRRYFQERLASDNVSDLGDHFRKASKEILDFLRLRLSNLS